jgi:hypothetical protein
VIVPAAVKVTGWGEMLASLVPSAMTVLSDGLGMEGIGESRLQAGVWESISRNLRMYSKCKKFLRSSVDQSNCSGFVSRRPGSKGCGDRVVRVGQQREPREGRVLADVAKSHRCRQAPGHAA